MNAISFRVWMVLAATGCLVAAPVGARPATSTSCPGDRAACVAPAVPPRQCRDPRVHRMAVTVIDAGTGKALPVYRRACHSYVPGVPGRPYIIRLSNHTNARLLAVVSVDGVNVITGQTASPDQTGYVLAAHADLDIDGWRRSLATAARFVFSDPDASYAARTGRPTNVGVIGLAIFEERESVPAFMDDVAADAAQRRAAPAAASRTQASAGLGTAYGSDMVSPATRVSFLRATPQPSETDVLEYDTLEDLRARGIAPPTTVHPDPFPARFALPPPAGHDE